MTSFNPCSLKWKIQFNGNRRENIIKYVLYAYYFPDTLLSTFTWHCIQAMQAQGIYVFTSFLTKEKIGLGKTK